MTETLLASEKSVQISEPASPSHLALRIWLWTVAAMIFGIVIVGGATRLTESGLSITEWKPVSGIIPPWSAQAWQEEFEKFKQIPQHSAIFSDLDLNGFKVIYFWEFGHRLLARSIGLVFALPFFIFWMKRMIPAGYTPKLIGVLALGALQGFVGWWMVSSGLQVRIEVAQERLAIHLLLASLTFAAVVYLATRLRKGTAASAETSSGILSIADAMIGLVLLQIFLGGLVAGLRAGRAFNSWPLMDGHLAPPGLFALEPWWRNILDNIALVQFQHRIVAYALFALAIVQLLFVAMRVGRGKILRRTAHLAGLVAVQAGLGITALLLVVPLWAALLHQAFAMVVLGSAARHRAMLVPKPRPEP
jgi:heme a synthase